MHGEKSLRHTGEYDGEPKLADRMHAVREGAARHLVVCDAISNWALGTHDPTLQNRRCETLLSGAHGI